MQRQVDAAPRQAVGVGRVLPPVDRAHAGPGALAAAERRAPAVRPPQPGEAVVGDKADLRREERPPAKVQAALADAMPGPGPGSRQPVGGSGNPSAASPSTSARNGASSSRRSAKSGAHRMSWQIRSWMPARTSRGATRSRSRSSCMIETVRSTSGSAGRPAATYRPGPATRAQATVPSSTQPGSARWYALGVLVEAEHLHRVREQARLARLQRQRQHRRPQLAELAPHLDGRAGHTQAAQAPGSSTGSSRTRRRLRESSSWGRPPWPAPGRARAPPGRTSAWPAWRPTRRPSRRPRAVCG